MLPVWRIDCSIIRGRCRRWPGIWATPEDRQEGEECEEGDLNMHIHGNQFDANLQVQASASAAKAEEKEEAERTRERLRKAASALAGEADADCVVRLSGDDSNQGQANQQNRESQGEQTDQQQAAGDGGEVFSDWA
jgi:hypothetical protein